MRTSSRNALALGAQHFTARYPREVMNPPSVSRNVIQKELDPKLIAIGVDAVRSSRRGPAWLRGKNTDAVCHDLADPPQPLDLSSSIRGHPWLGPGIDVSLLDPPLQRRRGHTQPQRDVTDRPILTDSFLLPDAVTHHPHRPSTERF